ncbi:hypothetical protein [Siphonobacter aquaeclarae]|nr:hypothetical protein [Siphonobacter aquaeclarae]
MEPKLPLEEAMEGFFLKSLPAFPPNAKDLIVQILPWLALIGGVIGLWAILVALGLTATASIFVASGIGLVSGVLSLFASAVTTILNLMAFSPLRANQRRGWNLLYYAVLINIAFAVVSGLFSLPYSIVGIFFAIIVAGVEFWILFQVRERYN